MNYRQPRALLLEHDDAFRRILIDALTELGFGVLAGSGRKQVLDILLKEPDPDLILVDLFELKAGGRALLSFLGEQPETAEIPVLVMTDGNPVDATERAVRITKPFSFEELRAALGKALMKPTTPPPGEPGWQRLGD